MFCSAVSHTVRYAHSLANRLELPEVVVQLAFGSHRTAMHIHEASRPIDNLRSARSESRLVRGYRSVDRTAAARERAGGCAANAPPARACDLHADGGLKRRGQSDGVIAERCAAPHQVLDLVSNIHVSPRTWPSGLQPPKTTYVAFLTDPPSRTSVSVHVPQPRLRDRPSCHRRQARPLLATVAPGARLRTSLKPYSETAPSRPRARIFCQQCIRGVAMRGRSLCSLRPFFSD